MNTQDFAKSRRSGLGLRQCDTVAKRRRRLAAGGSLPARDYAAEALPPEIEHLAENAVDVYRYPVGAADHFVVNGRTTPIFMATQERTVIAAASSAAKLCVPTGGFRAQTGENISHCQIPFDCRTVDETIAVSAFLDEAHDQLLTEMHRIDRLLKHGGGVRGFTHEADDDGTVVVMLSVMCGQAMGANAVTRLGEAFATLVERATGVRRLMAIVTNAFQGERVTVNARWPIILIGADTAERIMRAQRFASKNELRAATHNKGIANGICAVARATGQDEEAILASLGASSAARSRSTSPLAPLSTFTVAAGAIRGELRLELPVGTVGGATGHPDAARYRQAMGATTVRDLAAIMAAAGLASNFAALRCLVSNGIAGANERLKR
jgi:hydroxymethylglutaryl-CoA reductase